MHLSIPSSSYSARLIQESTEPCDLDAHFAAPLHGLLKRVFEALISSKEGSLNCGDKMFRMLLDGLIDLSPLNNLFGKPGNATLPPVRNTS